jgi:hypothetical protein
MSPVDVGGITRLARHELRLTPYGKLPVRAEQRGLHR